MWAPCVPSGCPAVPTGILKEYNQVQNSLAGAGAMHCVRVPCSANRDMANIDWGVRGEELHSIAKHDQGQVLQMAHEETIMQIHHFNFS